MYEDREASTIQSHLAAHNRLNGAKLRLPSSLAWAAVLKGAMDSGFHFVVSAHE